MNSFVDVNQCVISTVIHFNIFECPEFLNFVDPNLAHRNVLNQVVIEQAKRISNIIKQIPNVQSNSALGTVGNASHSSFQSADFLSGVFQPNSAQKPAKKIIKRSSLNDRRPGKKISVNSDSDSMKISDQKTR